MQSFRTELELIQHEGKALVEKDIIDLEKKIRKYREGEITDEKFRSLRLARGVYGQRQQGVQMVRIKLPFGRVSVKQLERIAAISDEYSNGNLHLTTRQDIQIHHVSLEKTPELWAKLEQDEITLREACGNTVRNVTASAEAGIDPKELFDVSPYAHEVFSYFLRKPFGQELGRKIKIAFSNTKADTAFTYIHDFGFIPKLRNGKKGFKVLVGGGLGAQPFLAQTAYEFLPVTKLIPFLEAAIRVFDRYGERNSRHKARIKYLINKIGVKEFLQLIKEEQKALGRKLYTIDTRAFEKRYVHQLENISTDALDQEQFAKWSKTNLFKQKQEGYYAVYVKIQLGNISSQKLRELTRVINSYGDPNDVRLTINQSILIKYVPEISLIALFNELYKLGLAQVGANSVADITACPGTDTCNLAISNSTVISQVLEEMIADEYSELIYNNDIKIKISGCMNSCGQHGLAQIGFHGSSFKVGSAVIPAVQVLIGGGTIGNGSGATADKIIKVASKRAPDVLRYVFDDYDLNALPEELFNSYYNRKGKDHFYNLLKPLADNTTLVENDFLDWGSDEKFETAIGVGECAGVMIDLIQTLFFEAEEKLEWSAQALKDEKHSDSIYYSYAAFIHTAKAILLDKQVHVNTHHVLIKDFDIHFEAYMRDRWEKSFADLVLQINKNEPSETFAKVYLQEAELFFSQIKLKRELIKQEEELNILN